MRREVYLIEVAQHRIERCQEQLQRAREDRAVRVAKLVDAYGVSKTMAALGISRARVWQLVQEGRALKAHPNGKSLERGERK